MTDKLTNSMQKVNTMDEFPDTSLFQSLPIRSAGRELSKICQGEWQVHETAKFPVYHCILITSL